MKCPTCGKQTKGRDHNKRGRRCTVCWALLPDVPPKPRRKRKARLPTEVKRAAVLAEADGFAAVLAEESGSVSSE